jgi:hypothetical protein
MMEALLFCGSLWNADMCEVGTLEGEECERACVDAAYDDEDGLTVALTVRIEL